MLESFVANWGTLEPTLLEVLLTTDKVASAAYGWTTSRAKDKKANFNTAVLEAGEYTIVDTMRTLVFHVTEEENEVCNTLIYTNLTESQCTCTCTLKHSSIHSSGFTTECLLYI